MPCLTVSIRAISMEKFLFRSQIKTINTNKSAYETCFNTIQFFFFHPMCAFSNATLWNCISHKFVYDMKRNKNSLKCNLNENNLVPRMPIWAKEKCTKTRKEADPMHFVHLYFAPDLLHSFLKLFTCTDKDTGDFLERKRATDRSKYRRRMELRKQKGSKLCNTI